MTKLYDFSKIYLSTFYSEIIYVKYRSKLFNSVFWSYIVYINAIMRHNFMKFFHKYHYLSKITKIHYCVLYNKLYEKWNNSILFTIFQFYFNSDKIILTNFTKTIYLFTSKFGCIFSKITFLILYIFIRLCLYYFIIRCNIT